MIGASSAAQTSGAASSPPVRSATWVRATAGGYLESVDVERLLDWACRNGGDVRVVTNAGAFVSPRQPVVEVRPARELSPDDEGRIRRSLVIGRVGELLIVTASEGRPFGDRERVRGAARLAVESARGSISMPADLERVVHAAAWAEPERLAT